MLKLSLSLSLSLLVASILLFLLPHQSHAASIIRAPNNLGLVGYWSFDEGRGTQVSDLSGRGNDGTLTFGPTWVPGKSGRGLELLSTSNQHVLIPNSSSLQITGNLTISAWVKLTNNNDYGGIVSKGSGNEYEIAADFRGGEHRLSWRGGSSGTGTNFSGFFSGHVGEWVHVVTVVDGTTLTAYRNGEEFGTLTAPSRSPKSTNVSIGRRTAESYAINGTVDEVRIYSRALSPTEIQNLYNNTKGVIVGTTNNTYTDGLVAHYTFDGSTISGNTLKDVVGSNDGTIPGGPTPTIGRIGQGMRFNGQNTNGINLGNSPTLNPNRFTVAAWIKTDVSAAYNYIYSNTRDCCSSYNGIDLRVYNNGVVNGRITNGTGVSVTTGVNAVPVGVWTHVAFSYDGSNMRLYVNGALSSTLAHTIDPGTPATYNARLGSMGHDNGSYYTLNGALDDVRIYNRALSPEEIRGLAGSSIATLHSSSDNLVTSGLVGHWSFDEGAGTTAADISGNGNNGTFVGGTGWSSGVIGGAVEFYGSTSDYINAGKNSSLDITNEITEAAWVYPTDCYDRGTVASKQAAYYLQVTNNCRVSVYTYPPSGAQSVYTSSVSQIPLNTWSHITFTEDVTGFRRIYVNGELDTTFQSDAGIRVTGSNLTIGLEVNLTRPFSGKIDDVRIYSRALTPSEIQTLYSMGR